MHIPTVMINYDTGNKLVDRWLGGVKINYLYSEDWEVNE